MPHLTDFPDRLPAMLVKELRQGMRARGFTMLFLVFQCLLGFVLLVAGSTGVTDNAGAVASGVIFTLFAVAVLGIQPMRGVAALSSEITGNTIEMMVLTRLSARRIVFGKWLAIVSQSALILTTIIPYLILRYFFGGMVLVGELMFLLLIFLTSMALTAVTVGLSGGSNKLIRVLPILLVVFGLQSTPLLMMRGGGMNGMMEFLTMTAPTAWIAVACYVSFIAYYGWCALSYGTSSIAPLAENHTTLRRLVALGLALAVAIIGLHAKVPAMAVLVAMGFILGPALIVSLTEPSIMLPPLCKPFLKRGGPGKIAAIFLLPGWPAGVFFSLLMLAIAAGATYASYHVKPPPTYSGDWVGILIGAFGVLGAFLLSAMLCSIFSRVESKRFANFLFFLVGSVVLTVIPQILVGIKNHQEWLWLMIWNPPVSLLMLNSYPHKFDQAIVLTAVSAVDGIICCALLTRAAMAFGAYRPVFHEVENEFAKEPASAES